MSDAMSGPDAAAYARHKALFLELIDLDDDARAGRLAELAAAEPALAETLRRQLAADARPLPVLDRAGLAAAAPRLAHYTLVRELGRGGMGRVWLAERRLGDACQPVALKQIAHADWTDDDRLRFERERRLLAGLQHPNIAALVDGGSDEAGAPFLATVYVDGLHLDQFVRTHATPLRTRVTLLRQVADAVAHAHRCLVVHRDLKPANVLVDADGHPWLLDFGIARRLGDETLTADGLSQMTLRYAAPEQVRAGTEPLGTGCDVYALGVLLYELVAERSPYGDARGPGPLVEAILKHDPEPPSRHASLRGADADLDAICRRALRKRVGDRYPNADALVADLDRWLARQPVEARRGERGYRLRTALRRHWPWLAGAAAVVVATGLHIQRLEQQRAVSERERAKAEAVAEFLVSVFRSGTPGETRDTDISARELLRRSAARLATAGDEPPAVRAAMLQSAGKIYLDQGLIAEAEASLATAVALLRADPQTAPETLAAALRSWSQALYESDRAEDSLQASLDAVAAIEASPQRGSEQHAGSLGNAAIGYYTIGDPVRARALFEQALEILEARQDKSRRAYALMLGNVAELDLGSGRTDDAERLFRAARDQSARLDPPDPDLAISAQRNLGTVLRDTGRLAEAETQLALAVAQARAFYGARHGEFAKALYHHGLLQILDGRLDAAEASLGEAERIAVAVRGDDHQFTADYRLGLAMLAIARGQPDVASAWLAMIDGESAPPGSLPAAAAQAVRCLRGERQPLPASGEMALEPWEEAMAARWRPLCAPAR